MSQRCFVLKIVVANRLVEHHLYTIATAVSLFWNTNMATVTSCESSI